jgi:hypothetical protein
MARESSLETAKILNQIMSSEFKTKKGQNMFQLPGIVTGILFCNFSVSFNIVTLSIRTYLKHISKYV